MNKNLLIKRISRNVLLHGPIINEYEYFRPNKPANSENENKFTYGSGAP